MPKANRPTINPLPATWRARIAAQPARMIPGYWNTLELAELLGVTRNAVCMQVLRGAITPIPSRHSVRINFFTDEEVVRYLTREVKMGRPPKSEIGERK